MIGPVRSIASATRSNESTREAAIAARRPQPFALGSSDDNCRSGSRAGESGTRSHDCDYGFRDHADTCPRNDERKGDGMRIAWIGLVILWSGFSPAASAADADADAGKAKAEICAGCHGENGISQTENIPSLAAQPDQFIQWQLVYFRAGSRKNEQMQPIVAEIS